MNDKDIGSAIRRDPGLARERTALAWSRTAFLLLINSLMLLKAGSASASRLFTFAGSALLLAACATYLWSAFRLRRTLLARHPLSALSIRAMRLLAGVISTTAALIALSNLFAILGD